MIQIRPYRTSDIEALWQLFFNTVHQVNAKDYSQAQIEAWAPINFDKCLWRDRMAFIDPVVAELNGEIVGYSDLQADGLIDHFFCHHAYQRQGVGKAIMQHHIERAESLGLMHLYAHVSVTARPFFERFGFSVIEAQSALCRGQELSNYLMQKALV